MAKRTMVRRGFKGARSMAAMLAAVGGVAAVLGVAGAARGQTYTWSTVGGNWDTTSANWSGAGTRWTNSSGSVAVFPNFGAGSETVNLQQNILAHSAQINGGYVISANGFTLTLAGPGAGLTVAASAALEPPIAGTDGLTINLQGGSISLDGASTYSGPTTVQGSGGEVLLWGSIGPNRLPMTTDLSLGTGTTLHMVNSAVQQVGALTGTGTVLGRSGSLAVSGNGNGTAYFQGTLVDDGSPPTSSM